MQKHLVTKTSAFEWQTPLGSTVFTVVFVLVLGHLTHLLWRGIREHQVSQATIETLENSVIDGSQRETAYGVRHGCLPPPQLPNHWPLGLDWMKALWSSDSEQRLLSFLCSVADDYEPRNNLSQYLLFGPRAYHVLDPRNLETILSTRFSDYGFGVRHQVFAPLLDQGIFTQEGYAWKHSRELLRNQFVRALYQDLGNFSEHVDNLIASLTNSIGVVDLQPLFLKFTLDTTTALLFGKSVYSLKARAADDGFKDFAENFDIAQEGLAKRFRLAPWHYFYNPPRFRRACSAVHGFVDSYIHERQAEKKKETDS